MGKVPLELLLKLWVLPWELGPGRSKDWPPVFSRREKWGNPKKSQCTRFTLASAPANPKPSLLLEAGSKRQAALAHMGALRKAGRPKDQARNTNLTHLLGKPKQICMHIHIHIYTYNNDNVSCIGPITCKTMYTHRFLLGDVQFTITGQGTFLMGLVFPP